MSSGRLIFALTLLLAAASVPLGCTASNPSTRPISATWRLRVHQDLDQLANRQEQDEARRAADARLIQHHESQNPIRLLALQTMVYTPGQSPEIRSYAMAQLAQNAPALLEQTLYLHLPAIRDDAIAEACRHAAKFLPNSPRLADALILRLDARNSPDALLRRPETTTLLGNAAPALGNAATRPDDSASLTAILQFRLVQSRHRGARCAAIHLLTQLHGVPAAGALVLQLSAAADDPFLRAIQRWHQQFHTLPQVEQEAIWMQRLCLPAQEFLMKQALAHLNANAALSELPPRLLAGLAHADPQTAALSHRALARQLRDLLGPLRHQRRTPQYEGAPDDYDESLDANLPKLAPGDLLVMLQLLDALQRPAFRAELLRLGLEDRADTTTEHGGWLTWAAPAPGQPSELWPLIVPPLQTGNDQAYIASDRLLDQACTALAIFHFHFQEAANVRNAGPGQGDLQFVRANQCQGVVITSLSPTEFDVDYYTPNGAVVDLGVWSSPPRP